MPEPEIKINESTHKRVPAFTEKLTHALVAILLDFMLVHLIAFWMFPGM